MTAAAFQRRQIRGTKLSYASLAEWLVLVDRIGGRIRCSRAHYDRCRRLYRSLSIGDIRSCRDIFALAACEQLFDRARGPADIPCGRGLQREMTRCEIGALLVETRNRLDALRSGRADRPRAKGPRFDPARIPDAALNRLIQRHPDLATVERLRAERNRRRAGGTAALTIPAAVPAASSRGKGLREICDGFSRARDGSRLPVTESPAMTASSKIRNIPLSQLFLSPANVRKTPATAAEDAKLEASIRAKGILQNLIVHPTGIDGRCVYEVVAGGRRLKILQKLAAEGVIHADDYKVPCKIEQREDAVETSLAENTVRAAMHPADEFIAMAALIDEGAATDAVAVRFGTSERHVKQRLRLGKLAPELLDAYRVGAIGLEAVTAFTLGTDHAAQLAVWAQLKDHSYIQPYTVKRLLTEAAVPLDSDLGMFVGATAYEAAGGHITRDLFSGDDDGFMDDAALVRRLAVEKLESKAAELRPQWKWTKAAFDLEYRELAQYARVEPQPADVPPELAAEIEGIEQRLGELEEVGEEDFTDELAAEAAKLEERRTEIDETIDGLAVYSDRDRARAGCIIAIGDDGEFALHQGLIERAAGRGAAEAGDADTGESGDDETWMPTDGEDEEDGGRTSAPRVSPEQALRKECGFSQLHVDDLKAHRHQITRAYLAGNFEVAFDLALYALATDLFDRFRTHENPLEWRASEAHPRSSLNDLSGTPADRLIEAQGTALDLDWLKLPAAQGFAALSVLPADAKQRLFAWCVASTLKPQLAIEDDADPVIEAAGRRLTIPVADLWRPTAANYWGRVKKAHGLGIGKDIFGDRWARDHAGDKKPVLAAALETAFDPVQNAACIGLDQEARHDAAAWLPPGMTYGDRIDADDGEDVEACPGPRSGGDPEAADDLPAFLAGEEPAEAEGLALAAE
jgi:ParB family transcriptional regulator, chromosome partitioning protein